METWAEGMEREERSVHYLDNKLPHFIPKLYQV